MEDMQSLISLWKAICFHIARQLHFSVELDAIWRKGEPYSINVVSFLERLLNEIGDSARILICLDEVNAAQSKPAGKDFFPLSGPFLMLAPMIPHGGVSHGFLLLLLSPHFS
jgi:hypothetical protein